jgi:glycosyltransferase involved in cell wall biosynthesis
MLPVTVWMNMPSFYQDDLFRELATKVDFRVVYDHPLTEDRRRLGWAEVKGDYKFCFLDRDRKMQHAVSIARSERDRIHIINGIWAETAFIAVAFVLGTIGIPFAIFTECPDLTVTRSLLTRNVQSFLGRWAGSRASGLFAVSHMASDYFSGLGFPAENIYPFGYFRASPKLADTTPITESFDIVYVGQLIRRKGLDILLEAIEPLLEKFPRIQLSLVGSGPEKTSIESRVRRDGLLGRVVLEKVHPASQIHDRLSRASALVLPSRWDGWGLVINEAFSAGVPVIASDHCGGADLILHGVNGYRFRSESVDDLRACLSALVNSNRSKMKAAALKTGSALTVSGVSEYLIACLEHMRDPRCDRPVPPWELILQQLESEHGPPHTVADAVRQI